MNKPFPWLAQPIAKKGVIDCNDKGIPKYQLKLLRLPARETRFARAVILIYCIISIAVTCRLYFLVKDSETEEKLYEAIGEKFLKLSTLLLFFGISFWVFPMSSIAEAYVACYIEQRVKCTYPYLKKTAIYALFMVLSIIMVLLNRKNYALSYDFPEEAELVFIGFFVLNVLVFLVSKMLQYRYCACKTCRKIKDVKIRYMNKTIEVAETDLLTNEFLFEKFHITRETKKQFSFRYDDATKIQRSPSSCDPIQLHEGTYILEYIKPPPSYASASLMLAPSTPLLEEVELHYQHESKKISNKKWFTQMMLKNWFDIEYDAEILIKRPDNGYDNIVHIFNFKEEKIILDGGCYEVVVVVAGLLNRQTGKKTEYTILAVD